MKNKLYSFLFILCFIMGDAEVRGQTIDPPFLTPEATRWADSVFQKLNYYERLGQLFVVATRSDAEAKPEEIDSLIRYCNIGGLMFLKGGPMRQAQLTNSYQQASKIPLLISLDGEWGLQMRLDSTIRFPRQMTLGAMAQDSLIYDMGKEIARQCKRLGIHINFAPDIDINNNASNPVINSRSFGEDKEEVGRKGLLYMRGMQDNGVLACGKHFPGHGNTDTDSHLSLPVINQNKEEIDSVELAPFRKLISNGVGSIMVAHLYIPSLDTNLNRASTLSPPIVNGLLKEQLKFKGLVFTDALNMKGVASYYDPGTLEIKALQAGNDVLLFSENVPRALEQIHYAIQNCDLEQGDIDQKIKKILKVKYWGGLNKYKPIDYNNLIEDINTTDGQWLNYRLYRDAMTLLINNNAALPIREIKKTASLVINDTVNNPFQQMMGRYCSLDEYRMEKETDKKTFDSLKIELLKYDRVILSIHNTNIRASANYGISDQADEMIRELTGKKKLIVCLFGNSYCLQRIPSSKNADAMIMAYEDTYLPQQLTAQLLFGSMGTNGVLPVSPSPEYYKGSGITFKDFNLRFKYSMPQAENFSVSKLSRIDTIANTGIIAHAYPGCQLLVAHNGNVILQKSYGYKTYDSLETVKNDDLYDIASVTKIAATALATMKLFEEGKIDLEKKISKYLPELKRTNKKDIKLIDMLTHQAGLKSWIPFYLKTIGTDKPFTHIYHTVPDKDYSIRVADSLFIANDYSDIIWKEILDSPVEPPGKYVYSDLGPLIMQRIIEKITGKKLNEYVEENFYKPMGFHNLTFKPRDKGFDLSQIVPTENDTIFRHQLLRGDVHDPAAAMLGGVAGNAGLFSDANSLAVIMQMLMQGGEYGGQRYLKAETVERFTKRTFATGSNRRGILFDKPEIDPQLNGPTCKSASAGTFGHTGFSGTCAWADPLNKIVYIFLSNRIHPDAANTKLANMNIRTDIMQVIYDARK